MTFSTEDSPDAIYAFYKEKLAENDWGVTSDASLGGRRMLGVSKGDRHANVSITGRPGAAQLSIIITEKK